MKQKGKALREYVLTLPSYIWLVVFFVIPSLIIFAYAFKPYDLYGAVAEGWTFDTIEQLIDKNLLVLLWRTLWLSTLTTIICLLIALPMGYQLMTTTKKWRNLLLMLIIVPFWSSFLIRIFAWKVLLHPEGLLHEIFVYLHIIAPETTLLYNSLTVLFVMVYNFLPFAVLPIFAAASKFDFHLFEAAIDLGASRFQAFTKIFIPGIRRGMITAAVMVFVPAIGTYVIPDLVGGSNSEMLGNKIAQKTFIERNLPEASALSAMLIAAIFIPIWLISRFYGKSKKLETEARNRE